MSFVIHYKGQRISSTPCDPREALAVLNALPLEPAERDALWGMWSCADALVRGHEDLYLKPDVVPLVALLDDIEDPEFRDFIATRPFDDVIAFMRDHWDELNLEVSL